MLGMVVRDKCEHGMRDGELSHNANLSDDIIRWVSSVVMSYDCELGNELLVAPIKISTEVWLSIGRVDNNGGTPEFDHFIECELIHILEANDDTKNYIDIDCIILKWHTSHV